MFGFFSMSASKISSAISTLSKYLIMKLSGEGYNREKNNVFLDESNNYFGPITANGNVTQGTLNPLSTNVSWFFDGSDSLSLASNAAFTLGSTDDFTIECWVNPSTHINSNTCIVTTFTDFNSVAGYSNRWFLGITNNADGNKLRWYDSAGTGFIPSINTLPLNVWTHIAVARRLGTTTLYVNGASQGTQTANQAYTTQAPLIIGSVVNGGSFNGYISNLRVVKGTSLYTSAFTPPTSVLTAISGTSLLTCQNTYLVDNSPNSFALTINGDAQSRHYGPFDVPTTTEITKLPARSVFFDGSGDYLSLSSNVAFSMGTGDFTWEAWIYPTSWANANHAVYATTATGGLFIGKIGSDFAVRAYGVDNQIAYNVLPTLNVWTHIAATRSGNSLRLFYNGVQVATATNSYSFAQAAVRIGADDGGATYTGYISNLRLVKGTAVYTSAFTPSTSELTAITNTVLLTCQGGAIADSSTNNFTITTVGDARVTANSPFSLTSTTTTITPVTQSWSGYFDGSGDYLTIPANTALNLFGGSFTIETWIYPVAFDANSYNYILVQDDGGSNSQNFALRISSTGAPNFVYFTSSNRANVIVLTSTALLQLNTWSHLAVVYNSATTTVTLYLNGNAVASSANAPWAGSNIQTCIGNFSTGANQTATYSKLNAYISNLRLVKGTAVYTSAFTPSTSALTAISGTALLTCNGPRFIDGSSNSFAITTVANAKTTMFGPFLTTGSMSFNGTNSFLSVPNNAAFSFGTADFTIELWLYTSVSPTNGMVIIDTRTSSANGYLVHTTGTNKVVLNALGDTLIISAESFNLNTWNHVAVTRLSNVFRIYINGMSSNSGISTRSFSIPSTLRIGQKLLSSSGVLNLTGYISNLRIVKGTAVYTSNFTPPTTDLTNISNTGLLILGKNNFNDSSSNNLVVTNSNASIHTNNNGLPLSPYASNYSVYFDGSGDYLTVADNAALQLGTGDFTLEFWWYSSSIAGFQTIVDKGYVSAGALAIQTGNGNGIPIVYAAGTGVITASSGNTVGSWNHWALVRVGTTMTLYRNGINVGSVPNNSTNFNNTSSLFIGGSLGGGGYYTNGYLSNVRIVKGTALYTSNFTPPTSALTAISGTTLLTCQSNRFIDNSSNDYAITTSGSPAINNSFTPYNNLYSWYFDGTGDYVAVNHSSAINILSGNFTVECWFNSEVASGIRTLMGQWQQTVGLGGWLLYLNAGVPTFSFGAFSENNPLLISPVTVNSQTWNHIAVTRNGNIFTMWLNGVSVRTDTSSATRGSINVNTSIGMYYNASGTVPASGVTYFHGHISNARILKGVSLYNSAFTPSTAPLITTPNTGLLVAQSNTMDDISGNSLNITKFGDTRVDPFTPFSNTVSVTNTTTAGALLGGTAYFDGTGDFLSVPANDAFIPVANEDFTIDFWWRPISIASVMAVLSSGWGTITYGAFVVYFDNTNSRLVLYASSANTAWDIANAAIIASNVKPNVWYHIAISRRAGSLRLFSNGVLTTTIASSTAGMYKSVLYPMLVGAGPGGVNPLNGYISNLRISRGAGFYTSNFTPPTTPVTSLASTSLLLNFRNAGIYDGIGDNIFETIGDSALSTVQKRNGNSSIFFDGTGDYTLSANNPMLAWGTGDFTIEFWMYSADVSGATQRGQLQTSTTAGGLSTGYTTGVTILQGSNRAFGALTGGLIVIVAGVNVGSNSAVISTNTWTHVAIARVSGTATLYINGTSVDSRVANGSITATNIAIGGYYSSAYLYSGYLDNLQINSYAKYTANFTPS